MDCKSARLLLEFARPRVADLAADDAADLEGHLFECPECGPLAHTERRLDEHLGQAMRAVPVPPGLAPRLLGRLAADRDRWYRQLLVRCAGVLGAAAGIIVLVWGGLIWRSLPAALDADGVVRLLADKPAAAPEKIEEWFQRTHNMRIAAPSDKLFDYRFLVDYRLEDFAGKRLPALLFVDNSPRSDSWGKVFIATDKDFNNLQELADEQPEGSGGFKIMVIPNQDRPSVFYIFVYKDGSETRFLRRRNPVA